MVPSTLFFESLSRDYAYFLKMMPNLDRSTLLCGEAEEGTTTKKKRPVTINKQIQHQTTHS